MKTKERTTMNVIYRVCAAAFLLLSIEAQATDADDSSSTDAAPAAIAFVNVNVVPMDSERILPAQTVIVQGDRISEVGPAETTNIPEGALRIDGHDKYLMPGLVDMHVHQRGEHRRFQLTLFIANGVTTVRNMAGDESVLRFREQIEAGELVGPTIYTTGPIIDGYPPSWPGSTVVETPEQAAQAVAEHKKAGYDFIKVYNALSLECYDAIIEAAAKYGMPVVGHVPRNVGIEHALAAGQHTAEHLYRYGDYLKVEGDGGMERVDEEKLLHIAHATRDAGMWNCVTLVAFQKARGMTDEEADQESKLPCMQYVPPLIRERMTKTRDLEDAHSLRMSNRKRVTKALHDAGARILLGTDAPHPYVVPGFSVHQELQNLVDAGLTPYEAIKAGTHDAAECLGEQNEFGTISAGLRADLLLIDGNPLEDVRNAAERIGVMSRGRWFPQSELQAMLDKLAIKHATEENPDGVMLRGRWYPRFELEAMADWCEERVKEQKVAQRETLVEAVMSSDRIYVRSASARKDRFLVRQLRQLGLQAHIVGEPGTPDMEKGDLLIVTSPPTGTPWTSTTSYDIASDAKSAGVTVVLLTYPVPSAKAREVCDLVFVLGPDFPEATEFFVDELLATTIVALRQGIPVGKMTYDDANDTYTVHGAGNEIGDPSDQFHFAHHKLSRDGSITARIDSVEPLDDWTVAGLMIRDTTASDSAYAAILITPENRICMYYRSEAGGNTGGIATDPDAITLPHWIKLIRQGQTFRAQHSEDGKKWKDVKGSSAGIEIEMDDLVHVGLAVCSEAGPAIAAEAKISRVSFGGDWSSSRRITWSEDIGYKAWGKPEEKTPILSDE
jgi:imidazolonepropionase-like amidohydrolase